jgi:DNA gyrase subunit B
MSDPEDIRKRPGMYIGDTSDGSGLHNMVYEVAHNAINEAWAGYGQHIDIILDADGSCIVRDNGRGIPVESHPTEHISVAEIILTKLAAPSFNSSTACDAKQLPGPGVAVVNALSGRLELRVWRNGDAYLVRFRDGEPEAPIAKVGQANGRRGTEIIFVPSRDIFAEREFNFATLERHFRQLARPIGGVTLVLADKRGSQEKEVIISL